LIDPTELRSALASMGIVFTEADTTTILKELGVGSRDLSGALRQASRAALSSSR
jgi:hypothetical protein